MRTMWSIGACALVVVAGACGDDGTTVDQVDRQASAWEQVIRAVALAAVPPTPEGESLPVVFALEAGGELVPAAVQVEVVNALTDTADVRFADDRTEIVVDDEPGEPVRDDGVLLAMSKVPETGSRVEVDVVLDNAAGEREFVVVLTGGAPTWVVESVDPTP